MIDTSLKIRYPNIKFESVNNLEAQKEAIQDQGLRFNLKTCTSRDINFLAKGDLLNHAGDEKANVALSISNFEYYEVPQRFWRYLPNQFLDPLDDNILICNFVAKRDIKSGEELFVNYGDTYLTSEMGDTKKWDWFRDEELVEQDLHLVKRLDYSYFDKILDSFVDKKRPKKLTQEYIELHEKKLLEIGEDVVQEKEDK